MLCIEAEAAARPDGMIPVALDMRDNGLCPVPLQYGRKRPPRGFRLNQWLASEQTDADVVEAFRGQRNIGVALGEPSGGLVCRDFDRASDYEKWSAQFPDLAKACPSTQTARGYHVYAYSTRCEIRAYCQVGSSETIVVLPDGRGEVRYGGYALYPPSRHPDGAIYEHLVDGFDFPFVADLLDVGLVPPGLPSLSPSPATNTAPEPPHISCVNPPLISPMTHLTVGEVVRSTLPQRVGQRHHCLFTLIRYLRSHPVTAEAEPENLEPTILEWHRLATGRARTKDFRVTWREFLDGWRRCRVPAGAAIAALASKAQGERVERLADLCRLLQICAGERPFFLACRTAGRLAGVSHVTAAKWLLRLQDDGRIARIRMADRKRHLASEYRYLGPLDSNES